MSEDEVNSDQGLSEDDGVPNKVKNYSKLVKNAKISYSCEWKSCLQKELESFDDLNLFLCHVSQHSSDVTKDAALDNKFTCEWTGCDVKDKEVPDKSQISRHVNYHGYHRKLQAQGAVVRDSLRKEYDIAFECNKDFSNRNIVPFNFGQVCCWQDCGIEFDEPEIYYRHVATHGLCEPTKTFRIPRSKRNTFIYTCSWMNCYKTFDHRSHLRSHLLVHSGARLAACADCGSVFANYSKLVDHINPNTNMRTCPLCSFQSPTTVGIKHHIDNAHLSKEKQNYKCHECKLSFTRGNNLTRHLIRKHKYKHPKTMQKFKYITQNDGTCILDPEGLSELKEAQ